MLTIPHKAFVRGNHCRCDICQPIARSALMCYNLRMQDAYPAKSKLTADEFISWALQAEGSYELVDGEIIEMPSEGIRQNVVKLEIAIVLREAVLAAQLTCHVYIDGVSVHIAHRQVRGPDAIVSVGPITDFDSAFVPDPLILVDVVSPISEQRDTIDKLADYFTLPTVQHYLIVKPLDGVIIHHQRNGDSIVTQSVSHGMLLLDPPALELDVARVLKVGRPHV
jgi:Uma2 family endonuclease